MMLGSKAGPTLASNIGTLLRKRFKNQISEMLRSYAAELWV